MAAIGKTARCALTNWNPSTEPPSSPERTRPRLLRGFALQPELLVLLAQPREFDAFCVCEAVAAAALVAIGLRDPVADRLRRWLKLFRQVFHRAAGANQFDQLPPELRRVWGTFLLHRGLLKHKCFGVHESGGTSMRREFDRRLPRIGSPLRVQPTTLLPAGRIVGGSLLRTSRTITESRSVGVRLCDSAWQDSGFGEQAYAGCMIDEGGIQYRWNTVGSKLDERGRRLFAAAEVRTAGWGGLSVVARITGLARSTINRGDDDLDAEPLRRARFAALVADAGPLPKRIRRLCPILSASSSLRRWAIPCGH